MWKTRPAAALLGVGLIVGGCSAGGTAMVESDSTTSTTVVMAPTTSAEPTSTTEATGFPVTVDAANGSIEIPEKPTAIVSLSPALTEMVYAIGAGDQVVAVDSFSNHPESAPVTDLTGFAPNVEAIVALSADLVLIDGDYDGAGVSSLTALGVPVLVLPAAADLNDVYWQIEQLGLATGNVTGATAVVDDMRREIDQMLASVPELFEPLTFYHELDDTYYSVTSETFIGQVYESMGLVNIADEVGEGSFGYPQLSEEYIIEQDPDLIFLADTICCGVTRESLADRPGWSTLTAVTTGSVIELDDDVASRWGPRIVEHVRAVVDAVEAVVADRR